MLWYSTKHYQRQPYVIYVYSYICILCKTFLVLCSYFIVFFFIYLFWRKFWSVARCSHTHRILKGHVVGHGVCRRQRGRIWKLSSWTWAAAIVFAIFAFSLPLSLSTFLHRSLLLVFPSVCLMNYEDTIGSKNTKATALLFSSLFVFALSLSLSLLGFLVPVTFN